jgi:hypothetical protein
VGALKTSIMLKQTYCKFEHYTIHNKTSGTGTVENILPLSVLSYRSRTAFFYLPYHLPFLHNRSKQQRQTQAKQTRFNFYNKLALSDEASINIKRTDVHHIPKK